MQTPDAEAFIARLRDLEGEYAKALRYLEKWEARAEKLRTKLEGYRLVVEDLGVDLDDATQQRDSGGLTAAVREAVASRSPGEVLTPDDLRPQLGEFEGAPTSQITKALVRMTEDEDPILKLKEAGSGKRQSRYSVVSPSRKEESGQEQTSWNAEKPRD